MDVPPVWQGGYQVHDVDNDEDGSARDCDKVTMRMMIDDDDGG